MYAPSRLRQRKLQSALEADQEKYMYVCMNVCIQRKLQSFLGADQEK